MSSPAITLSRQVMTKAGTAVPTDLALILERIEFIAKRISRELSVASLGGEYGYTGQINVQGEKVKKLDEWGNEVFIEAFAHGEPVCSLISEEMAEARHFDSGVHKGCYAILYDPIDGSSNTDVNGSLGTIFSVRRRAADHGGKIDDLLTPGKDQLTAGYILYGPSTQLVYTAGAGVDIFTLDRSLGEFILWRENVHMPSFGSTYAVNQGNIGKWKPGARKFVDQITSRKDKRTSYSLRYTGAFVADFHRCLLEGGIYLYPGEASKDGKGSSGKLRLMYELAPMALIAEQAGGRASNGRIRILDVVPGAIHERQPIYIGSTEEVRLAEEMKAES